VIREKKREGKETQKKEAENKPKVQLKIGDKVRMIDGKATGTIDSLEKDKAIVNYGIFTTNVKVDALEFLERKKK